MKLNTLAVASLSCFLVFNGAAWAGPYPDKPIRMIVPYSPGGGSDFIGRILAHGLAQNLGQQVIVDNREGLAGGVGSALGVKSAPDGYTLLMGDVGTMAVNPWIYKNAGYDPIKQLTLIAVATQQPNLFVASLRAPASNLKALAAYGKENPGKLSFAYSGGANQLGGRLFEMLSGAKLTYVPYKGGAPAVTAIAGSQVDLMMAGPTVMLPFIKSGRIRGLAVTGPARLASLPDVPTSREEGMPDFLVSGWNSVAVPAGTPAAIVKRLNAEIVRVIETPAAAEKFLATGLQPKPWSAAEAAQYVRSEYERWGKVVKASGVQPE